MSERQYILIADDDPAVTAALTLLLEGPGRTIFVCSDVESADMVLARHPITHVLTDVQFSGPFRFEGLHFLEQIRAKNPLCRIALMTGNATDALRGAAEQFGAAAVLAKPFAFGALERALSLEHSENSRGESEVVRYPELREILRNDGLTAVYQPIVQLQRDAQSLFGFEALTRTAEGWRGAGIAELFDYAAKKDGLADLNLAAIDCALREARALPERALLFLNIDPQTFDHCDVPATVRAIADRHEFPLARIVLEITERSGFADGARALRSFESLRDSGVRFALDDHGSAHSHLARIHDIRPSFIKISHSFGTAFEEDRTRTRIVRHVVLEGIESAATARAAVSHGIELGQGFHLGTPRPAADWSDTPAAA
jgi:EAL domain-containing protein (putative c-di-GMP-specific phosphodiesterase class I)/CheY-like chemotaxis protein